MTFMAGLFIGLGVGGCIGATIMAIFKMAVDTSPSIPPAPSICRGAELDSISGR
jgi:hypothetical protein